MYIERYSFGFVVGTLSDYIRMYSFTLRAPSIFPTVVQPVVLVMRQWEQKAGLAFLTFFGPNEKTEETVPRNASYLGTAVERSRF